MYFHKENINVSDLKLDNAKNIYKSVLLAYSE